MYKTFYYPFSALFEINPSLQVALLALIDEKIGGLLLLGEHGSAKSTLARSLSAFLPKAGQFVNMPLGTTEDRLLGSVDIQSLLDEQTFSRKAGLLETAHQGILYIDEINLAAPSVLEHLQDACMLGHYYLERDGLSDEIKSQFSLLASMNPSAGSLSDALLDRFALSLKIHPPKILKQRKQVLRWQLEFSKDSQSFSEKFKSKDMQIKNHLEKARKRLNQVQITDQKIDYIAKKMTQYGACGLRADIALLKTSMALAAWEGKENVEKSHIDYLFPFVMGHRTVNHSDSSKDQTKPSSTQSPKNSEKKPLSQNKTGMLQMLYSGHWGQMPPEVLEPSSSDKKKAIN